MGAVYREPDRAQGEKLMQQLIDSVSHVVPAALGGLVTLGQTLKKRAADVLALPFNHPGMSNGPTEAINGRLEHLRGSAPGSRNLTSPDPYSRLAGSGRNYTSIVKSLFFCCFQRLPYESMVFTYFNFPEGKRRLDRAASSWRSLAPYDRVSLYSTVRCYDTIAFPFEGLP